MDRTSFLLFGGKAVRAAFLFWSYDLLHASGFPVPLFSLIMLTACAMLLTVFIRPWDGAAIRRSPMLFAHAGLSAVGVLSFHFGLKHYGPLKTLLAFDFADVTLHYLIRVLGQKKEGASRLGGVVLAMLGYSLLLWLDAPEPALAHPLSASLVQAVSDTAQSVHSPVLLGLVNVSEATFGAMALAFAVLLTMLRKRVARRLYSESGGKPKRILVISMLLACVMLVPFALWSAWNDSSSSVVWSPGLMGLLPLLALSTVFVDSYVEPVVLTRLRMTPVIAVCCTGISYGVALVSHARWGLIEPSILTHFSFACVVAGIYLLFWTSESSDQPGSVMPFFAASSSALSTGAASMSWSALGPFLRHLVKEIWNDRESRRIFFFLFINLMFMFVEMVYGVLTNSLGLIADAFHMMFDCTALAIGLWASVVARWPATEQYSYGFGRVKVLSGFLNGVFLLFIGSFVLFESFTRLLAPPDIKSEKLLIVSVLGLCVNLVGIWAFHDLHGGGEHGGLLFLFFVFFFKEKCFSFFKDMIVLDILMDILMEMCTKRRRKRKIWLWEKNSCRAFRLLFRRRFLIILMRTAVATTTVTHTRHSSVRRKKRRKKRRRRSENNVRQVTIVTRTHKVCTCTFWPTRWDLAE
jgi:zinc transporter 5/7